MRTATDLDSYFPRSQRRDLGHPGRRRVCVLETRATRQSKDTSNAEKNTPPPPSSGQQGQGQQQEQQGQQTGQGGEANSAAGDHAGENVQGGKRDRSQQGVQDTLKDITKNQQKLRKIKKGESIRETKKSQQNVDDANKRIKSSQDIEQ
jgi:hypothetical protein